MNTKNEISELWDEDIWRTNCLYMIGERESMEATGRMRIQGTYEMYFRDDPELKKEFAERDKARFVEMCAFMDKQAELRKAAGLPHNWKNYNESSPLQEGTV